MGQEEMERKKLMSRIVAHDFAEFNGAIMRTINTSFRYNPFKISELQIAFPDREDELSESLNYLEKAGYLEARDIKSKAVVELQYVDPDETEMVLTAKGIRLVKYFETDAAVNV